MSWLWSGPANYFVHYNKYREGSNKLACQKKCRSLKLPGGSFFLIYLRTISTTNLERSKPNILASPYLKLAMAGVN